MIRNIFTNLLFSTESDEILLPVGSGMPVMDYRANLGKLGRVGERRENNKGNALVRDFRVGLSLSGKRA